MDLEPKRWSKEDWAMMGEALLQARQGLGRTHPNPTVGAVLAKGGKVVGKGYHHGPGTPHAEVEAIKDAGGESRGADLFVTLEPCCTYGRTPPCTGAVLEAGIRRVVAACQDPNPAVCGKGLDVLHRAGVVAERGLLEGQAVALDQPYHTFYLKGRPFVHLKWAQTLDGLGERPGGGYLTAKGARAKVHRDRFLSDAILVTASTAMRDECLLTVREGQPAKRLLRVILDRRGRITGREKVFSTLQSGDIWVVRPEGVRGAPVPAAEGVAVKELPAGGSDPMSPREVLTLLAAERVICLYVEAVGRLSWALLKEGLVDRLSVHIAPVIAGGRERIPAVGGEGFGPRDLIDLGSAGLERVGPDIVLTQDFPGATSFLGAAGP